MPHNGWVYIFVGDSEAVHYQGAKNLINACNYANRLTANEIYTMLGVCAFIFLIFNSKTNIGK